MKKSTSKKSIVSLLLVCLLLVGAVAGTLAWLTAEDSLTNQFVVGNVEEPTTPPEDPAIPDDPADPWDPEQDGYLWEPSWVNNSKVTPGATIDKDPYVGLGAGSEASYAYINIANGFGANVYFTLEEGWSALDDAQSVEINEVTYYYAGTFKYDNALEPTAEADAWVAKPLFYDVVVADDVTADELAAVTNKTIVVSSYLHQADCDGLTAEEIDDLVVAEFAAE